MLLLLMVSIGEFSKGVGADVFDSQASSVGFEGLGLIGLWIHWSPMSWPRPVPMQLLRSV